VYVSLCELNIDVTLATHNRFIVPCEKQNENPYIRFKSYIRHNIITFKNEQSIQNISHIYARVG